MRQLLYSKQENHSKYELLFNCNQLKSPKPDVSSLPVIPNPIVTLPIEEKRKKMLVKLIILTIVLKVINQLYIKMMIKI